MPFIVVKMTKIKKFNFGIDKNVGEGIQYMHKL